VLLQILVGTGWYLALGIASGTKTPQLVRCLVIFPLKPSFTEDFQMQRLITRGYIELSQEPIRPGIRETTSSV
jgi:hypothetical protein